MSTQGGGDHESVLDPIIEDLCKPIKDLRENFKVNIADYLERYIEEIHSMVDINGVKMNFSQAAMMIQGSVGCYSKKVDYLHQYSMKTLNMIGKDGGGDNGQGDGDPNDPESGGTKRRRGGRLGEGDFVFLDINIDKHTQKKESELSLAEMAKKLGFIQITPREFIEKEGLDCGTSKIEIFYGPNCDLLGYKQDFKMNSQFSMATATFGDRLVLEPGAEPIQRGLDETIVNENYIEGETSILAPPVYEALNNTNNTVGDEPMDINADHSYDNHDQDGGGGEDCFQEEEIEMAPAAGQHANRELRDCIATMQQDYDKGPEDPWEPEVPEENPWEPEDIFNNNEVHIPVKRTKTYRIPPSLKKQKSDKSAKKSATTKQEATVSISKFIVDANSHGRYHNKKFPYLSTQIFAQQQKQKLFLKQLKKNAEVSQNGLPAPPGNRQPPGRVDGVVDEPNQEDIDFDEDVNNGADAGDLFEGPDHQDDDDEPDFEPLPAFECPDPHAGMNLGGHTTTSDNDQDVEFDNAGTLASQGGHSYEELVAKMVAEFVQRSQAWLASTEMAKKVQSWHEMIAPRLQAVETRSAFDIHEYGSQILQSFPKQEENVVIPFSKVGKNKRKEEVSRLFLASLMLANCHNVEIESKGDINDMTMRFISTKRHHEELHEFQAASQQI